MNYEQYDFVLQVRGGCSLMCFGVCYIDVVYYSHLIYDGVFLFNRSFCCSFYCFFLSELLPLGIFYTTMGRFESTGIIFLFIPVLTLIFFSRVTVWPYVVAWQSLSTLKLSFYYKSTKVVKKRWKVNTLLIKTFHPILSHYKLCFCNSIQSSMYKYWI